MALDPALKAKCERLYVGDLIHPEDICKQTGVPVATFYRWRKDNGWDKQRELQMGMREKLGLLVLKLINNQLEQDEVDAQKIHGLVNTLEKFQKTGTVRERLVYEGDAVALLDTMKEMDAFSELLEDQAVLSELGERLREKRRQSA